VFIDTTPDKKSIEYFQPFVSSKSGKITLQQIWKKMEIYAPGHAPITAVFQDLKNVSKLTFYQNTIPVYKIQAKIISK